MADNMVVLAVHSPVVAHKILDILEFNGISAQIRDSRHISGTGLKTVYVPACDLEDAVSVIERIAKGFKPFKKQSAGTGSNILVPVDFSSFSHKAVQVGFQFAEWSAATPVLIHAFPDPAYVGDTRILMPDSFGIESDAQEMADDSVLRNEAVESMAAFASDVRIGISESRVPDVGFVRKVAQGIPEGVIVDAAREMSPLLIVMATRGIHKKAAEVIGSVTAEVIDSAVAPLFTVPENFAMASVRDIGNIAFLCSLSGKDVETLRIFDSIFSGYSGNVSLVPLLDKSYEPGRLVAMQKLLEASFPKIKFDSVSLSQRDFRSEFEEFYQKVSPQLLIVQNRKRNIISRLFNPGVAHRILFEKDVPMLVIPD